MSLYVAEQMLDRLSKFHKVNRAFWVCYYYKNTAILMQSGGVLLLKYVLFRNQ